MLLVESKKGELQINTGEEIKENRELGPEHGGSALENWRGIFPTEM